MGSAKAQQCAPRWSLYAADKHTDLLLQRLIATQTQNMKKKNRSRITGEPRGEPRANHGRTTGEPRANHGRTTREPRANHGRTTGEPRANHGRTAVFPFSDSSGKTPARTGFMSKFKFREAAFMLMLEQSQAKRPPPLCCLLLACCSVFV